MIQRNKRITALLLLVCLILSVTPFQAAWAASDTGTSTTVTTPEYFLVKEEEAGRWLGSKNYIHYITIGGQTFPAYCVESSKKSPVDGTTYFEIDGSAMKYSQTMMEGLQEILRNGYPYTTVICGIDFGSDTVKAQAATQAACRMWASYRKDQENANYNVFGFWNPEPKRGKVLVKAGTAEGADRVYNAAIALFQLAKSGQKTVITAAFDVQTIELPTKEHVDTLQVNLNVSMKNCDYATLSFSIPSAKMVGNTKADGGKVKNGQQVQVLVPSTEAGKTLVVVASGYSTKMASSLRFYAEDSGHRQRLFVGRTDSYDITVTQKSIGLPTNTPTPERGDVSVSKRTFASSSSDGGAQGEELKGAHLQIIDENGQVVVDWVTDGKEKKLDAMLIAGATYTLHEVSAPEGYLLAKDQKFTVNADGTVSKVVMEDKPTRVEISKKSALDGSLLSGALLQIYDGNTKVYEWRTDGKVRTLVGKLTAGKTYRLHEEEAPKGYLKAEDVTFTVSTTGATDKVEMIDDYTKVVISKVSLLDGTGVTGAKLSLSDSNGTELEAWLSDGTPKEINAVLVAGEEYTLTEQQAPDGFYQAESVTFVYGEENSVVMQDAPTVVTTYKKDMSTKELLSGATLQILDMSGKLMEEWVSNGTAHNTVAKLTAGAQYILHEVKPPAGYQVAKDIVFSVPKKEEKTELILYNSKVALPSPKTGDSVGSYVMYGIFSFMAAVNTGILTRHKRRKKEEQEN